MSLTARLTALESSGLIQLTRTQPELEYLFRHALIQDAAYESLLKTDRKRMHFAVGITLERLYPDRLEEIAPLLARHFCLGDAEERGIKYYSLAGDAAARVYANAEAYQHYRAALNVMRQCHPPHDQLEPVYLKCGRMCEMIGRYDEALTVYEEMEEDAREAGDEKMKLAALIARATVYCAPTHNYDPQKGESLCAEARELAQRLKDRAAEAKTLWNLALLSKFVNRWDDVLNYGEAAIAIARELNLRELLAFVLNDIYPAYLMTRRLDAALQALEESSSLWRESNNLAMLGDNLTGLAGLHWVLGNVAKSRELGEEAYQLSLRLHNSWGRSYSAWGLGQVFAFSGEVVKAISYLEEAIRYGEEAGFRIAPIAARGALGLLLGRMGQIDRGQKILQEAVQYGQQSMPRWVAAIFATQAIMHVQHGDLSSAADTIAKANTIPDLDMQSLLMSTMAQCELKLAESKWMEVQTAVAPLVTMLRESSVKNFALPNLLYYQSQASIGLGRVDEARAILIEAASLAETIQYRNLLFVILIALSKLETDPSAQNRTLARARETVMYIADHAPADLRDTFLQTPEVLYIMERT